MPALLCPKVLSNITKLKPVLGLVRCSVRYYATTNTNTKAKNGLPATISQADAVSKFQDWANELWFAPKEWKFNLGDKITAHYLPHWYFSGVGAISYIGKIGFNRTYKVVVDKKVEYRTTIDWSTVPQRYIHNYEFSHATYASYELERDHVMKVGKWDIEHVGPLPPTTSTTFDTYTIDSNTAYSLAWNEKIGRKAEKTCLAELQNLGYNADHYDIKTYTLHESQLKYSMIYFPAYVLQYEYLGQEYHIIMNARTGKIRGYRQYDGDLISLALLGVTASIYFGAMLFTHGTFTLLGAIGYVLVPPLVAGTAMRYQPHFMKRYYRPFMKSTGSRIFSETKNFPETGKEEEHEKIHQEQEERARDSGYSRRQSNSSTPKTNLYSILGVPKNATQAEIKKAYHVKAMETHPDRHPENRQAAETKFKEVNQAYQVLSDRNARAEYDRTGTFR